MINLHELPVANFPDGHKHLIIPDDYQPPLGDILWASIRNFDDLFLLAQARQLFPSHDHLHILYLLAARCDRKFSKGEALDLEIVSNFINSLGFEKVTILKPHSEKALELINNSSAADLTGPLLRVCEQENNLSSPYALISPDAGAAKWAKFFVRNSEQGLKSEIILCRKKRSLDSEHREVENIVIPNFPNKDCVIVDDLCDGGGTFIRIARELREREHIERIFLVVNHGIFSKGFSVFDGLIDRIYCTNSFGNFEADILHQMEVQ